MSHAPSAALSARHTTVREALAARTLDALVITSLPNILYLTNFTGSAAIVVLTADRLYFITDFRYVAAVSEVTGTPCECPGLDLVKVDGSYDATLSALLMSPTSLAPGRGRAGEPHAPRRIGFEAAHLTVSRHLWLISALSSGETSDTELVATEGIVERARLVKDAFEIATLREAARRLS